MLTRVRKNWELSERDVTPEAIYLNRRSILKGAAGLIAAGGVSGFGGPAFAQEGRAALTSVHNDSYTPGDGRQITPEDMNIHFNNFYEYGSHKRIAADAEAQLKPRPWQIVIDGLVDNPMTLDVDELMAKMTLEERIYRHRCVEAWSMVVPWVGFPVKKLVDLAQPKNDAKFIRMETFGDPEMASGIRSQPWYPWPYVEGITMAEATNDLPFLAVGAYGKVIANSMGAPIRLHLPWKFGFKSIKSIVKFSFVAERPVGYWERISMDSHNEEYGFWANVNPDVPHPRWSQATEQVLDTGERIPTQIYNGYGEQVASLYANITGEQLFR